jgi:hypothetical protein
MAISKQILTIILICMLSLGSFSGCLEKESSARNHVPKIQITYPAPDAVISYLVIISGEASDADGNDQILFVQVKINDGPWKSASGTTLWSYDWNAYDEADGLYTIAVRAWDGQDYSKTVTQTIQVKNPVTIESDNHRWAVFITAANFPESNESKLGNGGLYLAEGMASYFVTTLGYPTTNIIILFDDGWIRADNGYGEKIMTLQQRPHTYNITYGSATRTSVEDTLNYVISTSNQYRDSEVFIWIFNHGYGDINNTLTGGKALQRSHIFLWDDTLSDRELGKILGPLKSQRATIIIDACYSGGFADKTILNQPTALILRSGIPRSGRIVISGSSKFRPGYASTTEGPLFTLLWFNGLTSGSADGFRPGLFSRGRPTQLSIFKDGQVSVEEAFYYACYELRTTDALKDYRAMEPQINDRYPHRGILRNMGQLILGED